MQWANVWRRVALLDAAGVFLLCTAANFDRALSYDHAVDGDYRLALLTLQVTVTCVACVVTAGLVVLNFLFHHWKVARPAAWSSVVVWLNVVLAWGAALLWLGWARRGPPAYRKLGLWCGLAGLAWLPVAGLWVAELALWPIVDHAHKAHDHSAIV